MKGATQREHQALEHEIFTFFFLWVIFTFLDVNPNPIRIRNSVLKITTKCRPQKKQNCNNKTVLV
jgi:hypothetical protein